MANQIINSIEKFNSSGVGTVFASTGLAYPFGLAFDSTGNLYAANKSSDTIEKFTPGGTGSLFASTGLGFLGCLAFTNDAGQPLLLQIQPRNIRLLQN